MTNNYRQLVAEFDLEAAQPATPGWDEAMLERLEGLPMTQPEAAVGLLCDVLQDMLQAHSAGGMRLKVLGQMAGPAHSLSEMLARRLVGESHPLPAGKGRVAELLLRLRSLEARNQCIAIWELADGDGKVPLWHRKRVTRAANVALERLRDVLVLSYLRYREPPPGTWLRLHALLGFAVDAAIADKMMRLPGDDGRLSARQRYVACLLLAAANPWGLQRSELEQATRLCLAAAGKPIFESGPMSIPLRCGGADSGPGTLSPQGPGTDEALNIQPAVAWMEEPLAAANGASVVVLPVARGQVLELRVDTVQRMVDAWRGPVGRRQAREQTEYPLAMLVGMQQVHRMLAGGLDFDGFCDRLNRIRGMVLTSDTPDSWLGQSSVSVLEPVEVRVLDESAGGYRLMWPLSAEHRVRIGQLVAPVQGDADDDHADDKAMMGVVRWLRDAGRLRVMIGVELLASRAVAAMVRVRDENGRAGALRRALLVAVRDDELELILERILDTTIEALDVFWLETAAGTDQPDVRHDRYEVVQQHALSPAYYRLGLKTIKRNPESGA